MSAQRLSPRSIRRIAKATGIDNIKHALAHGGHVFEVVCSAIAARGFDVYARPATKGMDA